MYEINSITPVKDEGENLFRSEICNRADYKA